AYMSPEQARGKTVDRRTDIWAYGCVLYEMLTARQAFSGETVSDTIAAILAKDLDFDLLPQGIPRHLKRVLRRCLERNPARRWQHIGDVRVELLDTAALEGAAALATPAPRRRVPLGIACGLLALAVGAESILLWRQLAPEEARPLTRFTIASPAGVVPDVGRLISISSTVAISADGKRIVFVGYATGGGGLARLYTRSMDSIEVKPIPGSESATGPFLSPDGEWVAFIAGGKLRKVALSGGVPLVLSETATAFLSGGGGKWLSDGTIIFSVNDELLRISAAGGGTPEVITKRNPNEGQHVWPEVLPGEDAVLFAVRVQGTSNQIAVQSLRTGERKILVQDGAKPRYSPTGHVLYARSGSLMALPFDKNKLEPTGPPFTVLDDLDTDGRVGLGHYDVSNTGTLIYLKGIGGVINSRNQLVWVDRQGKQQPLPLAPRLFEQPRLSPDGTQAAFRVTDVNIDVWIHNLVRGSITRLTFHSEEDETPIWAPDGKLVAFVGSGKSQTVHSYEAARRERERTADRRADGFRALEFLVPRRQNNRIHALRSHDSR
ncbi:MAG: PD40 domain-containing protein, partial [Acidobacteria bacterium]|nr:PD40 domain-containing protein [Acidobacteriota bacterium]